MAKKAAAAAPAPHAWDGTASLSEFASALGVEASYVTQLKTEGRLVLSPETGRVYVVASVRLIDETGDGAGTSSARRKAKAQADKAEFDAETARLTLAELKGDLWRRDEIRLAANRLVQQARISLEVLPAIKAPELAALNDEGRIRVSLTDAVEATLAELSRQFDLIAKAEVTA